MTWRDIGAINVLRDWQFSNPISGNLIRIKHEVNSIPELTTSFRGLISVRLNGNFYHQITEIFSTPTEQIFLFQTFPELFLAEIAIRNISKTERPNRWIIRCYEWDVPIFPNQEITLNPETIQEIIYQTNNSIENNTVLAQSIAQEVIRQNQLTNEQVVTEILTFFTGGV